MALLQPQLQQKVHVSSGGGDGGVGVGSTCKRTQTPITHTIIRSTSNSTNSPSLANLRQAGDDDPVTLDLFHSKFSSIPVELDEPRPLPFGWQRFLDLKTGSIYYKQIQNKSEFDEKMSRNGASSKLDLKLNLSPPRMSQNHPQFESSPNRSTTSSPTSSCVSSEDTETETSMVLVGCPRCLMYVMLSEEDPKCPKCKSTVLLDFLQHQSNSSNNNNNNNNKNKTSKKN